MRLEELLDGMADAPKLPDMMGCIDIPQVTSDSRDVIPGALFVALQGPSVNGAAFIPDAIARGAKVIVYEVSEGGASLAAGPDGVLGVPVANIWVALRHLLLRFYQDPCRRIGLIGITGTNGKTTVAYLLESIFGAAGRTCGVIGTVEHRFAGRKIKPRNTTPGLIENFRLLADMAAAETDYCAMEVSSHALHQGRVAALSFRTGVFTNLTSDHLDYHGSQDAYFAAKALLFQHLSRRASAVINTDDPFGKRLELMTPAKVITYGCTSRAEIRAKDIASDLMGSRFTLITPEGECPIATPLIGEHNVYNILAAVGVAVAEDVPLEAVRQGVLSLKTVPGRMERVEAGQDFHVFIDFAHTEDALKNVLSHLRRITRRKVLLVFGCGGDRDRSKRPRMGQVAGKLADRVFVTSDNPRSEDPAQIIADITPGFSRKNYTVEPDRRCAIAMALREAREGDVVVVAGKGHEGYQIFKDQTVEFDERRIIAELLGRKEGA